MHERDVFIDIPTYIMNLLDGHVGLGGDVEILGEDVDDDEDRVGRVSLDEFIDLQVG